MKGFWICSSHTRGCKTHWVKMDFQQKTK